jgi:biopolymer transport protein ExbB/TolQ
MTRSQPSARSDHSPSQRRPGALLAALLVGAVLATATLYLFLGAKGPLRGSAAMRYLQHPVERAEVVLFCIGLGVFLVKLVRWRTERAALSTSILPTWDGQTVPVSEAGQLLVKLEGLPRRLRSSLLGGRVANVLDFLRSRGSAAELDDQLRALADADAVALENSYSFSRFIAWAIPILGFLGTVLGITEAVSGVTPEKLERELNQVTEGLALAFDTTALALCLTMALMFLGFVVERAEQNVLDAVDRYAERELAHRFERTGAEGGQFVEVVRQNTQVLLKATEELVQRQADVWAEALHEVDRRRAEAEERLHKRLTASLEEALERTLEMHARQLIALEQQAKERGAELLQRLTTLATTVREASREQQTALAQISRNMGDHAAALSQLLEGEQQLLQLQDALNRNLTSLAGAGSFDQAVHSLTAAIHLLTAYLVPNPESKAAVVKRPGAAA